MTWNSSVSLYDYNRSYSSSGNYTFNVSCNKPGYDSLSASDDLRINGTSDTTAPLILFVDPTPANNSNTTDTSVIINVSIVEENLQELNYIFGENDGSTVLMLDMDGDATDEMGIHNATANGAILTTGKYGQGYYLDGINDYLSVPDSSDWDIPTGKDFTIGTWVNYPYQFSTGQLAAIVTAGITSSSPNQAWLFYIADVSGTQYLRIGFMTSYGQWTTVSSSALPSIEANRWNYVSVTRDGSSIKFYLDGEQYGSAYFSTSITDIKQALLIGAADAASPTWFKEVFFDEVKILNKTLTESEIKGEYISNSNKYTKTATTVYDDSLVLMMNMEDATDSSIYGNDGTVSGATLTTGKYGQAYYFDGVNDNIDFVSNSNLNFGTKDFTINTWVKGGTQESGQGYATVFTTDASGSGSNDGASLFFTDESASGLGSFVLGYNRFLTSTSVINDDVWHNLVVTRIDGVFYLYVDGILNDQDNTYTTALVDFTNSQIGYAPYSPTNTYLKGSIDEFKIYNRSLSNSEISTLYHSNLQKINSTNWDLEVKDRKSTRLNSSHTDISRMPSSA